jgi:hypothetical protein
MTVFREQRRKRLAERAGGHPALGTGGKIGSASR